MTLKNRMATLLVNMVKCSVTRATFTEASFVFSLAFSLRLGFNTAHYITSRRDVLFLLHEQDRLLKFQFTSDAFSFDLRSLDIPD